MALLVFWAYRHPPPCARGPGAFAPTAGQGLWVLVFAGACQGTAWAGLCLIHHNHHSRTHKPRPPIGCSRRALSGVAKKTTQKVEIKKKNRFAGGGEIIMESCNNLACVSHCDQESLPPALRHVMAGRGRFMRASEVPKSTQKLVQPAVVAGLRRVSARHPAGSL